MKKTFINAFIIIVLLVSFLTGSTLESTEGSFLDFVTFQKNISSLDLHKSPAQKQIHDKSMTTGDYWINPAISCSLKTRETPLQQYPYKSGLSHKERIDTSGFFEFCSRMELLFGNSGVPLSMADEIYMAILKKDIVRDGSYGMPGSGTKPKPGLTLEEIKGRVKIRKIDDSRYEIFYKYTSCGTKYVHESISIENGEIAARRKIEAWSGSYPC